MTKRYGMVCDKNGRLPITYNAIRFIFSSPDQTSDHIAAHGIFEKPLIEWCKEFVSPLHDFVDVGAHAGTYALSLAPHCRKVFAFEPQRMTYFQLCGGIALNQYDNVYPFHCAVGAVDGYADLKITTEDGGGSTLDGMVPRKFGQSVIASERVDVRMLDSFESLHRANIGLMKIDVEGWELEVLRGATTLITKQQPCILFEAWPDGWFAPQKHEIMFYLNSLGYDVRAVEGTLNMFMASPPAAR